MSTAKNVPAAPASKDAWLDTMAQSMGSALDIDPRALAAIVRATVMPKAKGPDEVMAFMAVCAQYRLNPLTRQIYAFPTKGGGIAPVVGVDGWIRLANDQPSFDGMAFEYRNDAGGNLSAVTCRVHRKDRSHPVEVTEWMSECAGTTDPWKRWPARMLRHKAMIQALRIAFGFAGIVDEDEAERMGPREAEATTMAPRTLEQIAQRGREIQAAPTASPAVEVLPRVDAPRASATPEAPLPEEVEAIWSNKAPKDALFDADMAEDPA